MDMIIGAATIGFISVIAGIPIGYNICLKRKAGKVLELIDKILALNENIEKKMTLLGSIEMSSNRLMKINDKLENVAKEYLYKIKEMVEITGG